MRALLQRVSEARVEVGGAVIGEIGEGLLVLACAMRGDAPDAPERMAGRIAKLRVFRDAEARMNRSVLDAKGAILVVSQFTLAADTARGNRPGFSAAAPPEEASKAMDRLAAAIRNLGLPVATGRFGADMKVSLVNDGPVTIWLDDAAP
ncbi:D-tyrosyl-tRNA(Tyr) deacylase [Hasllibacter halocynthiae]|uniref:D-aminoacyl-tRNA deacylase n=1 Tax=Hasllibacter halocynthiae TaxID=595589 RepID=A0A2T0X6H8_9RHOB|nr:D-aminoacyl-tRNA deacylase [Hasllibacter halocynthiae]PRY94536.1 D-tyrosyl-tRNA(Tyr) deacylase [Hasllibacter halocynthiae]